MNKVRAQRNRTITLSRTETKLYSKEVIQISQPSSVNILENKIVNQDTFEVLDYLPESFVDLLILDPPYNLTKTFNSNTFKKKSITKYAKWLENLLFKLLPTLKKTASIYVCSEWYSSTAVHLVLEKLFQSKKSNHLGKGKRQRRKKKLQKLLGGYLVRYSFRRLRIQR